MKVYSIGDRQLQVGVSFRSDDGTSHPSNWAACWKGEDFDAHNITVIDVADPEPPAPPRRLISKSTIVDRLYVAGKFDAACAVLDNADRYTRERWLTRDSVFADDETLVAMMNLIGADVAVILGPE